MDRTSSRQPLMSTGKAEGNLFSRVSFIVYGNEREESCSMCGDFCAMKKGMEVFAADITHKTA